MSDRYDNLLAVSAGLQTQGSILKIVGMITFGGGGIAGYWWGLPFGVGIVALGVIMGVGMYVMGTMVAAMGEGLLALSDIAVNTKRVP